MYRTGLTAPPVVEEWLGERSVSTEQARRTKRQQLTSLPRPIEPKQQQAKLPPSECYEWILRCCNTHPLLRIPLLSFYCSRLVSTRPKMLAKKQ